MKKPSDTLIALSKRIGHRSPLWVQGNGGNISEKSAYHLLIKASGARLEHMEFPGNHALVAMKHLEILNDLLNGNAKFKEDKEVCYSKWVQEASTTGENFGRASMETGFHLILKKRFVLHFHSIASLLLGHELKSDKGILNEVNTEGLDICHLEVLTPGFKLTQALKDKNNHDVYILDNHGVILQGEDDQVLEKWNKIEIRFLEKRYPELLAFYKKNRNEVFRELGRLKSPMRIYFPDTAVYYGELSECIVATIDGEFEFLEPEKKLNEYTDTKNWKKLNLLELWAATVALNRHCPDYPEIPKAVVEKITNLPSEAFRKASKN